MGRIVILPDTLCNQIAAGEVVERPAAVVKELVENSIDAGGRRIFVSLLQGGRKEIRVVDNGVGMSHDDALLALERHATSKIKTIHDLQSIRSLGFRGEALPSIGAVSRFELVTKETDGVSGTHIRIEGGILKDVREAGCPPGTMVTVRDLFHNIPARRKFLRSIDTEMAHISDQFLRISMAHPEIHFQLSHEGRTLYDFPQTKTTPGRAGQVLGGDLMANLRPFSTEAYNIRVHGFASGPDFQRSNGNTLFVYVNGRPVRDRTLNHALLSAYDALIPKGKFPAVVLFVEIPASLVDVNVHPTKREVRFRNPGELMEVVRDGVRSALEDSRQRHGSQESGRSMVGHITPIGGWGHHTREVQVPLEGAVEGLGQRTPPASPVQVEAFPGNLPPAGDLLRGDQRGAAESPPESEPAPGWNGEPLFSRLPLIGQLANTYLLLEAPGGLIIIDQHAAHERIVFEQLMSVPDKPAGQRLTQSVVLELFPKEAAALRRWIGQLKDAGFEIEPFGGDSFVIHAIPAILSEYAPENLIREMLKNTHEDESEPRLDLMASLAKTAACHGAIRAGQRLRPEEVRHLLESLDRLKIAATCPHGRPLWFKLTHAEIARFFQRT